MRFFLLLFIISSLNAQESLRTDHSIFDTCPNPKKCHIASRTVYTYNSDDNQPSDTLKEYFNRKGQLISQVFYYAPSEGENANTITHRFTYDKNGRILSDSVISYSQVFLTTYEYSNDGKRVVIHSPPWRGDTITRIVNYDNHGNIISDYHYSANGDVRYEMSVHSDTTTTITRKREFIDASGAPYGPFIDASGTLITLDSTVEISTPTKKSTFTALVAEQESMQEDVLIDRKNKITDERTYLDGKLRESYHYTYDKKGKLISFADTIFPMQIFPDDSTITIWHMKYYYDKQGRLIRDENWSEKAPETIYITNYFYNERGLLNQQQSIREKSGKQEREYDEMWMYSYYGR